MTAVHAVGRVGPGTAAAVCRTISVRHVVRRGPAVRRSGRLELRPAIAPARPVGARSVPPGGADRRACVPLDVRGRPQCVLSTVHCPALCPVLSRP